MENQENESGTDENLEKKISPVSIFFLFSQTDQAEGGTVTDSRRHDHPQDSLTVTPGDIDQLAGSGPGFAGGDADVSIEIGAA